MSRQVKVLGVLVAVAVAFTLRAWVGGGPDDDAPAPPSDERQPVYYDPGDAPERARENDAEGFGAPDKPVPFEELGIFESANGSVIVRIADVETQDFPCHLPGVPPTGDCRIRHWVTVEFVIHYLGRASFTTGELVATLVDREGTETPQNSPPLILLPDQSWFGPGPGQARVTRHFPVTPDLSDGPARIRLLHTETQQERWYALDLGNLPPNPQLS